MGSFVQSSVVTPGNHDGVHRGHRALVHAARGRAADSELDLRVVAMTFDPHPTQFVAPDRAPPLLTTPQRRAEILRAVGADQVVVKRFDSALAAMAPRQFVEQILVRELGARAVVVGSDFRFGAGRAGDIPMLRELGAPHGIDVQTLEPVMHEGAPVSSSRVRACLTEGDVDGAAQLLTRVHDVTRRVVRGDQRGRTIGFPTANLELSGLMPPADGVYAVVARVLGEPHSDLLMGVANLGVRPTVQAGRSVEVHLFDFDADLYGRLLRVGFVQRLRPELKFDGLQALKRQIAQDASQAREVLQHADRALWEWI